MLLTLIAADLLSDAVNVPGVLYAIFAVFVMLRVSYALAKKAEK